MDLVKIVMMITLLVITALAMAQPHTTIIDNTLINPPFISYSYFTGQKRYNVDIKGEKIYQSNCIACHLYGAINAPRVGDKEDWKPRIAQGMDTLYRHAREGFVNSIGFPHPIDRKLRDEDIKKTVEYMVAFSSDNNDPIVFYGQSKPTYHITAKNGKELYQQICITCHEAGVTNAPITGNKNQWQSRNHQGKAVLYRHAIEGYKGKEGIMPAKGGIPDINDELIKSAVDYMLQQIK